MEDTINVTNRIFPLINRATHMFNATSDNQKSIQAISNRSKEARIDW
jgi:hypothetical protein